MNWSQTWRPVTMSSLSSLHCSHTSSYPTFSITMRFGSAGRVRIGDRRVIAWSPGDHAQVRQA